MEEAVLRAVELARQGHTGQALQLLRAIVQRAPGQLAAWKWLAYLTPDPQEALTAAWQILALDPHDAWARHALQVLQSGARGAAHPAAQPAVPPRRRSSTGLLLPALLLMTALAVIVLGGALLLLRSQLPDAALVLSPTIFEPVEVGDAALSSPPVEPPPPAAPAPTAEPENVPLLPADTPLVPTTRVSVSSQTGYYSFEAETVPAIQQALNTLGPLMDGSSERAIAVTSYQLWLEWTARQSVTSCQISDATVHLDLTYTYPQWIPVGQPDPAIYDEWDRFSQYVVAHEEHHGEIALQCAYELADVTARLQPLPTCTDVEQQLNAAIETVYADCERRQRAFDDVEGRVSFPLPQ